MKPRKIDHEAAHRIGHCLKVEQTIHTLEERPPNPNRRHGLGDSQQIERKVETILWIRPFGSFDHERDITHLRWRGQEWEVLGYGYDEWPVLRFYLVPAIQGE